MPWERMEEHFSAEKNEWREDLIKTKKDVPQELFDLLKTSNYDSLITAMNRFNDRLKDTYDVWWNDNWWEKNVEEIDLDKQVHELVGQLNKTIASFKKDQNSDVNNLTNSLVSILNPNLNLQAKSWFLNTLSVLFKKQAAPKEKTEQEQKGRQITAIASKIKEKIPNPNEISWNTKEWQKTFVCNSKNEIRYNPTNPNTWQPIFWAKVLFTPDEATKITEEMTWKKWDHQYLAQFMENNKIEIRKRV